jgi:hypothetical protein
MDYTRTKALVPFGLACLVISAFAETVHVPGRANPWLAGMTNGSAARRGDSAPDESPVAVTAMAIEGGAAYTFSASGLVNHGSTLSFFSADGEDLISHYLGAENGIADITAPFVSLIGVFLGPNSPDREVAPRPLDFRHPADRDFLVLAPELRQPFFIGDGLTSSGAVQHVIGPPGATRLFLGVMDEYHWSDNEGAFTVQVAREASTLPVRLPLHPSARPGAAEAVAYPSRAVTESTLLPTNAGPEVQAFTAIELVWPSEANRLYQVQWTPSLDPEQWTNFGPVVRGTGNDVSVFDSTRVHAQGFYRVQVLP